MDLEIPLSTGDSNFTFATVLLGQLYYLNIRLNLTADLFVLTISTARREPIASFPMFPDIPLGYELVGSNPLFPKGVFFFYDERDTGERPDIETIGTSYKLIFRSL